LLCSGFADKVGREHFFSCNHDAVNWCLQEMDVEAVAVHAKALNGSQEEDQEHFETAYDADR
jgi:hypothetical protein